jgi:inhibitor of KinA
LWEWKVMGDEPPTPAILGAVAALNQAHLAWMDQAKEKSFLPSQQLHPWLLDLVPAYQSIGLVYDPVLVKKYFSADQPAQWVKAWGEGIMAQGQHLFSLPARQIQVPVCYDLDLAPDLVPAAQALGMSVEALVSAHTQRTYRVCFLGFLPGFPYMASTSKRIQLPRHAQPRTQVAAGSVGIAEWQTGIYPVDAPGGWQIIGRTPLCIFDPQWESPCFFQPGDQVVFEPISRHAFDHWPKQNT